MINRFYGKYRWLSNFWPVEIVMDGQTYKTVENAYQAAKEENPDRRKLYQSITPKQAKQLGRKATLRKDWEEVKLEIMEALVRKKFQNPSLKKKLIATGDQWIIEGNEWGDIFWGVYKGQGKNYLGIILMKIRQECIDMER